MEQVRAEQNGAGARAAARCARRPAGDWYDGGVPDDPYAPRCLRAIDAGVREHRLGAANRNLRRLAPPWVQPLGVLDLADGAIDSLPLLLAKAADVGFVQLVVVTRTERIRRPVQRACQTEFIGPTAPDTRCLTTTRRSVPSPEVELSHDGPVLLATRFRTAEAWRPWSAARAVGIPTLVVGCNLHPGVLLRFAAQAGFGAGAALPRPA